MACYQLKEQALKSEQDSLDRMRGCCAAFYMSYFRPKCVLNISLRLQGTGSAPPDSTARLIPPSLRVKERHAFRFCPFWHPGGEINFP